MRTQEPKLTTAIAIDAEKVTVDLETKQAVIVSTVNLVDDIVAEFNLKELMDAAIEHFGLGQVADYVGEKMEEENEFRKED